LRGSREPRAPDGLLPLREFVRTPERVEARVRARLVAVGHDAIALEDGRKLTAIRCSEPVLGQANAVRNSKKERAPWVVADLARVEERVVDAEERGYRARAHESLRSVITCGRIATAPEAESWAPKNPQEVQFVIAWTARLAAFVVIVALFWWASRGGNGWT